MKFKALLCAFLLSLAPVASLAQSVGTVQTSGPLLGNAAINLSLTPGQSNCAIAVTGTFTSGTLNFLLSNDNTNFFASPTDSVISATTVGMYFVTCASAKYIRIQGANVVGSVTVAVVGTAAVAPKGGGGASSAVNLTQVNGTAIGSATDPGTSVSAISPILGVQGATGGVPLPVSGTVTTVPGTTTVIQPTAANLNATVVGTGQFNVTCTAANCPTNNSQWGGAALGAATAAGTSPSGNIVGVQGVTGGIAQNVSQATAANLNATVVATNLSTNTAQFGGTAATPAVGYAGQKLYPVNTSGGGCDGVNTITGTQIIKNTVLSNNIGASLPLTQIVPLAASKFIHICHVDFSSGTVTTPGLITLSYGTGTNCGTGTVGLFAVIEGGAISTSYGDGSFGIFDVPSGNALCLSSGATVAVINAVLTVVYAQY